MLMYWLIGKENKPQKQNEPNVYPKFLTSFTFLYCILLPLTKNKQNTNELFDRSFHESGWNRYISCLAFLRQLVSFIMNYLLLVSKTNSIEGDQIVFQADSQIMYNLLVDKKLGCLLIIFVPYFILGKKHQKTF